MADSPKYPFMLVGTFFLRLEFRRKPEIAPPLTTTWTATIRVDESSYPKFDVFVTAVASDDQPFSFTIELLGRFNVDEGMEAPTQAIIPEFLSNQALYMLWPYVVQAIAQASAQMGMPPVQISTPAKWQIGPSPSASSSAAANAANMAG
jgi:preprotein translocase subunit SecB